MNSKILLKSMVFATCLMPMALPVAAQSLLNDNKELSTNASHTISGEELQHTAATTLKEALYGRLLGLTVLNNGQFIGDDGAGATFNIRGTQTTSENNILILVDGIKRSIDYLTVDEVESVTVLRDGAATAIYGYEGLNGAILIKTKRGAEQKLSVQVGYNHKFVFDPKTADFVDAPTYAKAMNQARLNDGLSPMYNQTEIDAFANQSAPYYYPQVDWKHLALKDMGAENRINLALNGGSKRLKFFSFMDYTDCRGLLKDTKQDDYNSQLKFSKANIRTNIDAELTTTTTMQVNLLGSFVETNRPAGVSANDVFDMFYKVPSSAFPVTNNPDGELAGVWGGNTTYSTNNVIAQIQSSGFRKSHSRLFQGDITLRQDLGALLDGLSVAARFGYNNYSKIYEHNTKGFMYGYERYTFDADGSVNGLTTYSAGDKTDNTNFNYWQDQHLRSSYLSLSADYQTQFTGNDHFSASLIWNQQNETPNGQYLTFNRMNWMACLHYDLNNKYIANLTLAANGSNRSYPEKWSFSPALSLGYIFANNDASSILNYGKLRLSGAIRHLDYVPINGIWLENYNGGGGDYYFGAGNGYQTWGTFISYQPTDHFKLETAYQFNLGADLRVFKHLDLTIDGYYNYRDNILLSGDGLVSSIVGVPSGYVNWGRVASYGVEVGANWVQKLGKDVSLNLGGQFTWGRNRIRRTIENVASDYLSSIDGRVNQAWGLEVLGFFADDADIANSPEQEFDNCKPGDFKYKDQNGDGAINENDVVKMGYSTSVPELNYAINMGLKAGNFGFSALLQGAGMFTRYMGATGVWTPMIGGANLTQDYYDNCWDNSNAPQYPRLTSQANNNNYRANNVWWKNVNFLKLRNCEVYYLLPKSLISHIRLSQCKIFVKGENLLDFSNMKQLDAETMSTGYPIMKTVSVGASLLF